MSSKLKISLSCGDYDRTRALFDGRAPIEGCEVTAVPLEPEEAFHRAYRYHEYDVTEISMSSHMMTTARGDNEYIAIPAFLSRVFRHSGIYVRTDRGIDTPQDLRGKTIGVPEYQITANVWIRGILEDAYGVKPQDISGAGAASKSQAAASGRRSNCPTVSTCSRFPTTRPCRTCWRRARSMAISVRGLPRAFCAARPTWVACSTTT